LTLLGLSIRPAWCTFRQWITPDHAPRAACTCCSETGQPTSRTAQDEPCGRGPHAVKTSELWDD
jgi:hypothetical protein